jgi:hypothetical protein
MGIAHVHHNSNHTNIQCVLLHPTSLNAYLMQGLRLQGVWTCSIPVLESASRVKWRVGEGWGRDRSFAEVVAASVLLVPSKKNVLDASSAVAAPTLKTHQQQIS